MNNEGGDRAGYSTSVSGWALASGFDPRNVAFLDNDIIPLIIAQAGILRIPGTHFYL